RPGGDDLVAFLHAEPDADAEAQQHRGDGEVGDLLAPAFGEHVLDLLEQRVGAVLGDGVPELRGLLADGKVVVHSGGGAFVVFRIGHRYSSLSSRRRRSPIRNPTPTEISSALPGLERT